MLSVIKVLHEKQDNCANALLSNILLVQDKAEANELVARLWPVASNNGGRCTLFFFRVIIGRLIEQIEARR